jgi:maltose-binding protein MalE
MSQFDIENEPLYHNNSILPCQWKDFTLKDYKRVKEELKSGKAGPTKIMEDK